MARRCVGYVFCGQSKMQKIFISEAMHDYNLLVCLFICVCIAVIIMAVVCEYFICPTVGPLNVDPYLYYYTIKLNIYFF